MVKSVKRGDLLAALQSEFGEENCFDRLMRMNDLDDRLERWFVGKFILETTLRDTFGTAVNTPEAQTDLSYPCFAW